MTRYALILRVKSLIYCHRKKKKVYKEKNSRIDFFTVSAMLLFDLLSVSKQNLLVQNVKGRN